MIEDYFQSILDTLSAAAGARGNDVAFEQRSPDLGFIRGNLYFGDDSLLHFRELVNLRIGRLPLVYVYHYQRADRSLIFRYDNSEHFPDLPNYPHHKHVDEQTVSASETQPTLAAVIEEIQSLGITTRGSHSFQ